MLSFSGLRDHDKSRGQTLPTLIDMSKDEFRSLNTNNEESNQEQDRNQLLDQLLIELAEIEYAFFLEQQDTGEE